LNVTESNLLVTTNAERKYRSHIGLKVPVDPESAKANRNDILNVSSRVKGKSNKGIKISIE